MGIENFDLASIPRTWKKFTVNPLGSAALAAGAVGGAAYLASPLIMNKLQGYMMNAPWLNEQQKAEMAQEFASKEGTYKKRLALLGGGLAGLGMLGLHYRPGMPNGGLTQWDYFKKDTPALPTEPEVDASRLRKDASLSMFDPLNNMPATPLAFTHDSNMYTQNVNSPIIPIGYSRTVIDGDPHLQLDEKAQLTSIINRGADGRQFGMMSTGDLVRGGVHAGFGYVGGAILGGFLGNILGMPSPVVQAISVGGGLAAGVKATGLF